MAGVSDLVDESHANSHASANDDGGECESQVLHLEPRLVTTHPPTAPAASAVAMNFHDFTIDLPFFGDNGQGQ